MYLYTPPSALPSSTRNHYCVLIYSLFRGGRRKSSLRCPKIKCNETHGNMTCEMAKWRSRQRRRRRRRRLRLGEHGRALTYLCEGAHCGCTSLSHLGGMGCSGSSRRSMCMRPSRSSPSHLMISDPSSVSSEQPHHGTRGGHNADSWGGEGGALPSWPSACRPPPPPAPAGRQAARAGGRGPAVLPAGVRVTVV